MDQKGYVMSGLSFLLLIPAISLIIVFVDMTHIGGESLSLTLQSDATFSVAKDVEENIPTTGKKVLRKTADDVIKSGNALQDSRAVVKNDLQTEMNYICEMHRNNTGINVTCTILSVDSSQDPLKLEINSIISVNKDKTIHNESIIQYLPITDTDCSMPDPLPFIKCKNYGGVTNTSTRIVYGSSLVNLLNAKNMTNTNVYQNAESPLFIKKCPYDPYISHGNTNAFILLKNCIDNGYFHESSDGACYLCRLEGKATCPHYGIEIFIIPSLSLNSSTVEAPCSVDHVLFNGTIYNGKGIEYYLEGNNHYNLFLDNGHRQKYGLPMR